MADLQSQIDELIQILTIKTKEFASVINRYSDAIIAEGPLADAAGLEKSVAKISSQFEVQIEEFRKRVEDNAGFIIEGGVSRSTITGILTDFSSLVAGFAGIVRQDPFIDSFEDLLTRFEDSIRGLQGISPFGAPQPLVAPSGQARAAALQAEAALPEEVCPDLLDELHQLIEDFRHLIDSSKALLTPLPDFISGIPDPIERITKIDAYLNLVTKQEALVKSFEDLVQSYIDRSAACTRLQNLRFELAEQNLKSIEDLLKSFEDLAKSRLELRGTAIKQFEDLINSLISVVKTDQEGIQKGFTAQEDLLKSIEELIKSLAQLAMTVNTTRFKNFEDLATSFEALLKSLTDLIKELRALAAG